MPGWFQCHLKVPCNHGAVKHIEEWNPARDAMETCGVFCTALAYRLALDEHPGQIHHHQHADNFTRSQEWQCIPARHVQIFTMRRMADPREGMLRTEKQNN